MCGVWIQWIKAGITCNLYSSWKRAGDDEKDRASQGYLSRTAKWFQRQLKVFSLLQSTAPGAATGAVTSGCFRQQDWGDEDRPKFLHTAVCPVGLESETWVQWLFCHYLAVLGRWKSGIFQSWRDYALHSECMKILSFLREENPQHQPHIICNLSAKFWHKALVLTGLKIIIKTPQEKCKLLKPSYPDHCTPFIVSVMRFCPLI